VLGKVSVSLGDGSIFVRFSQWVKHSVDSWDMLNFCSEIAKIDIRGRLNGLPSGKQENYGKSPFLMGKSTINGHFQ